MTKTLILIFSILFINFCNAQKTTFEDSLFVKRKILHTEIYKNSLPLTNKRILELYKGNKQATTKFKWGNAMKPLGIPVAIGGIALATIAIRGEDRVTLIDGKEYPYIARSLPKLLIGLGIFVGGGCLIESSNELVANSARVYNGNLKSTKKISYFGITNDGISVGMRF
jgi:hypothetical protein